MQIHKAGIDSTIADHCTSPTHLVTEVHPQICICHFYRSENSALHSAFVNLSSSNLS